MAVDFKKAFRDGYTSAPAAVAQRTEIDSIVDAMMAEVNTELASVDSLACVALVSMTGAAERAMSNERSTTIAIGETSVLLVPVSVRRDPQEIIRRGVELFRYRRPEIGYPVQCRLFDGRVETSANREALEGCLARMLRDPHTAGRIRNSAANYAPRQDKQ